jgi:hypothetical protein
MRTLDHDQIIHDLSASLNNFKTVQKLLAAGDLEFESAKVLLEAAIKQLEETKKEFFKNFITEQQISGNHAGNEK